MNTGHQANRPDQVHKRQLLVSLTLVMIAASCTSNQVPSKIQTPIPPPLETPAEIESNRKPQQTPEDLAKDRARRRSRAFADAIFLASGQRRDVIDSWFSGTTTPTSVLLPVLPVDASGIVQRDVLQESSPDKICQAMKDGGTSHLGIGSGTGVYLQKLSQTPQHIANPASAPAGLIDYFAELPPEAHLLEGIAGALLWLPDLAQAEPGDLKSYLKLAVPAETAQRLDTVFPGLEILTANHMACVQFKFVHAGMTYRLTAVQKAYAKAPRGSAAPETPIGSPDQSMMEAMVLLHKDGAPRMPNWGHFLFKDSSTWRPLVTSVADL